MAQTALDRRNILKTLAAISAAAAFPARAGAEAGAAVSIGKSAGGFTIPADYAGLSYEAAQLANPDFFSPANHDLVALFRGLSPNGNLRIGGGSSEYTRYSDADPAEPPPFEIFGPDTSKTVKHGTVTSAKALRNLRGFLEATGWSCLYGLNFGQGTKENAAAEAAAAQRILGPRLIAVQIGNEPDSFRKRYRPAEWMPADFISEWNAFHEVIAAAAPGLKFAGPDISNKLDYLTAFAAEAPRHRDVVLLTGHYYAMGPAGSPDATLEQLMTPDPKTATLHLSGVPTVQAAIRTSGLPFRMSEGNSCWDGGKAGVSDTLASALWCADSMLRFASWGWVGVNWHGGGNGHYTPIAGAPSTGFQRRPEYYGIEFAQKLVGETFLPVSLSRSGEFLTAYAFERRGKRMLVLINKGLTAMPVTLPTAVRSPAWQLTGPARDAKQGTRLETVNVAASRRPVVPAHSAMLYTL
jgi:hypothetical protein